MAEIINMSFNNKRELHTKEREYIEKYKPSLNKSIPLRTGAEYRRDNKDKKEDYNKECYLNNTDYLKKYKADYNELNKEKIKQHKLQKVNCVCGSEYALCTKARHEKTKKHISYINNN